MAGGGWGRSGWDLVYFDSKGLIKQDGWSALVCDFDKYGVLTCGKASWEPAGWQECGNRPSLLGIGESVGVGCAGGISVTGVFV